MRASFGGGIQAPSKAERERLRGCSERQTRFRQNLVANLACPVCLGYPWGMSPGDPSWTQGSTPASTALPPENAERVTALPLEPDIERPLGPLELMVWHLDQVCCLNVVVHAEIEGRLSSDALRRGLDALQRRHALTRVRLAPDADGNTWYRSGVGPIPLRIVESGPDDWQDVLRYEANTRIPAETGPLVRVTHLRQTADRSTLLITFHHAMGDALSGAYLARDLVEATALACQGREATLAPVPPGPYVEARFPRRVRGMVGWLKYFDLVARIILNAWWQGRPATLIPDQPAAPSDSRWYSLSCRLEPDFTRQLAARARRERTTVNGALAAALAMSVAREFTSDAPVRLNMGMPVDVRRRLIPPAGEECGAFATGITCLTTIRPRHEFWNLARTLDQDVKRSLARDAHFLLVPKAWRVYFFYGRMLTWFLRRRRGASTVIKRFFPPPLPVSLSNIGRVDIACGHGPLRILSMGFVAGVSVLVRLYATATTLDEVLYWHIGGVEPILSRRRIEGLAAGARSILQDAVGQTCSSSAAPSEGMQTIA